MKKELITDDDILVIFNIISKEFQSPMKQVYIQMTHLRDYLIQKNLIEPANVLEKSFKNLRDELTLKVKINLSDEFISETNNDNLIKKNVLSTIRDSYQEYINAAYSLLVDTINDLKGYFPEDFKKEVYLENRSNDYIRCRKLKNEFNKKNV